MPVVSVRALGLALALVLSLLAFATSAVAAPINDDFADALAGAGDQLSGSGNNFGASKEPGEPDHAGDPGGASVWFAWTAPRSQLVHVQFCADGWDGRFAVYRGDSVANLAAVAAAWSPDSGCAFFGFRATSAVTYRFAVDGSSGGGSPEQGNFDFEIYATPGDLPANDLFANAANIATPIYQYVSGNTTGATREPGEPGRDGDLAGASVWFRWTAPSSGPTQVLPCTAAFRPTLAVYTGATLASLRLVSSPVPIDPYLAVDCQLGGLGGVGFDAVAGESYAIVVDGADTGFGDFTLKMHRPVPPVADVRPPNTHIYWLARLPGRGIKIRFGSAPHQDDTFLCKLDSQPFGKCRSPRVWRGLAPGKHRIAVVAIDAAGNRDPSPAVRTFRIGAGGK